MAIEPKTPRKRAVKKVKASEVSTKDVAAVEIAAVEAKKPVRKKATAVPVPIFQAAPDEPIAKSPRKKAPVATVAPVVEAVKPEAASNNGPEDAEERANRNRRRRRGGRGRRKPGAEGAVNDEESEETSESSVEASTHRRRRRRVAGVDGVTPGESVEEDGVVTVVKVREVRERPARPARTERTERPERRSSRTTRTDRGERTGRSEYREPYRKRGTIITDGEFLARRENVDREMLVRQIADRTQIAVIEDGVMVEHYVNRNSNVSYVGNVYLGRVQNVLPSMEAAFVDIGKGRNAVLYAGEVNWDAAGISESQPRKIETVLKSGQSVLVQVTKDPIGQKGARLTSQIS
ncbi:MAG: S1 RNA-binding domain-containing protein, partial [Actinobacteria bacterium]|nr:S1 RNA-binding domain-containing protein [Actinomycetota bacterium]